MIVSDASILITLLDAGCINVLHEIFQEILIPPEVFGEVFRRRAGRQKPRWIKVRPPEDPRALAEFTRLRQVVDLGEAAAIALALELQIPIIIDDKAGVLQCELRRIEYFSLYRILGVRLGTRRRDEIVSMIRAKTGTLLCEPDF